MAYTNNAGNMYQDIKITNGASDSEVIDLRGVTFTGFITPAALTGSSVSFLGSLDNTNFYLVRKPDGAEQSVTLNGAGIYKVSPADFLGVTFLKIRSNAAEAAERQLVAISGDYTE